MKNLLLLSLLLLSTNVWACDSYEDCMEMVHKFESSDYARKVHYIPANFSWDIRDHEKLEAIAYKLDDIAKSFKEDHRILDEIRKKLDKK